MDFEQLIARMDANTCSALRRAVEIGKFPDGRRLTDGQRALCMEAVLAWELKHLPPEQHTGHIDRGAKAAGEVCDSHDHAGEQPLNIRGGRNPAAH
ncbi:MAG: YeaC family protein [Pseudomonadota bacterium]